MSSRSGKLGQYTRVSWQHESHTLYANSQLAISRRHLLTDGVDDIYWHCRRRARLFTAPRNAVNVSTSRTLLSRKCRPAIDASTPCSAQTSPSIGTCSTSASPRCSSSNSRVLRRLCPHPPPSFETSFCTRLGRVVGVAARDAIRPGSSSALGGGG